MEGENRAAAVSASKVVADSLTEGRDTCARCAANDSVDVAVARQKVERLIEVQVEQRVVERTRELTEQLEALTQQLEALRAETRDRLAG